jgi:hypothetical protein
LTKPCGAFRLHATPARNGLAISENAKQPARLGCLLSHRSSSERGKLGARWLLLDRGHDELAAVPRILWDILAAGHALTALLKLGHQRTKIIIVA